MKKKLILLATIFLVCVAFTVPALAEGERDVRVLVNKSVVDFPDSKPFINEDNFTMVPVRFVSDKLDATADWNGETKTVTLSRADRTIVLVIGDNFALVNGEKVEFGTAADLMEGRTMVPLRFVSETFGADVKWDGRSRTVYITMEPKDPPPPPAVTTITLYFSDDQSDDQAQYLVPEIREVELTKPLAEIIFDELTEGPDSDDLRGTIPEDTSLVSLVMFGDIAQIFLSAHFRDNHTGGTAAEQMTLYSIVNSLAELSEVNKVLFLLVDTQGDLIETEAILGHYNTEGPLLPRKDLVR